jgi:hypothetical protein
MLSFTTILIEGHFLLEITGNIGHNKDGSSFLPLGTRLPQLLPVPVGRVALSEIHSMDMSLQRLTRFLALLSLAVICLATTVYAGLAVGGRRSVGGVMIDGAGIVRTATIAEQEDLAEFVRQGLDPLDGEVGEATEMRMISLKGLQRAITQASQAGDLVPDEVEFLAGLQRIEYVFVDQDNQDIIIAGPAEPWVLRDDGFVVGSISGGSTMRLADLAVAFRSVEMARREGISCSIEPTPEGRLRLRQLLRRVKLRPGQNPAIHEAAMKEAFGPQMIQLTGIPTDSRYARTLVAADFEMKRIAMGLTDSSVDGLPSYLQLSRNSPHSSSQNPRWWMACNYDGLSRSEDGLAWKLSGPGVKTLTEQDLVASDGSVKGAGTTDKLAQIWADKMMEHFAEVSREMPVFSDLRNIMDMTVVATLVVQERLATKAGLDLAVLTEGLHLASYAVPKAVDPQCSFIRGRSGWVVTASGGVDINAFEIVEQQKTVAGVEQMRTTAMAAAQNDGWWWDK